MTMGETAAPPDMLYESEGCKLLCDGVVIAEYERAWIAADEAEMANERATAERTAETSRA